MKRDGMRSLPSAILALALGLPIASSAATIVLSDGQLHVVPGVPAFDDGDAIALEGSTRLRVLGPALVANEFATSNVDLAGGVGLATEAATSAWLDGGQIVGGEVAAIADAATPESGLAGTGGTGIDAFGALEILRGGTAGGNADVVASPPVLLADARGGVGLLARAGSLTQIGANGVIAGGAGQTGGANASNSARGGAALVVESGARAVVQGGSLDGGDAVAEHFLVVAGGAMAEGGPALSLESGSAATVHAGSLSGGEATTFGDATTGAATSDPGCTLRVQDGSLLALYGGTVANRPAMALAPASANPVVLPAAAFCFDVTGAAGRSKVTFLGGVLRGDAAIEVPFSTAASPGAVIEVFHADLDSGGTVDLRLAHPDVLTRLWLHDPAVDGLPVQNGIISETTGMITGTTFRGAPIAWTFERTNDAPLHVVIPEPSGGLMAGLAGLVALSAARRRVEHGPQRAFDAPSAFRYAADRM